MRDYGCAGGGTAGAWVCGNAYGSVAAWSLRVPYPMDFHGIPRTPQLVGAVYFLSCFMGADGGGAYGLLLDGA